MSKFVWKMSELHRMWRKAKEEALKEAKKGDKATVKKVEKWMKSEFDRGLGDRFDAAHKAFESLAKAWDLASPKLDQLAVRDKFAALIDSTLIKLNPAELVLDSYRQSLNARYAKDEIPAEVVSILLTALRSLQKEMDDTSTQIAQWKQEYDEFLRNLMVEREGVDIQDLIARYAPEMLIK